jgi:sec-independent protein translocase protein TatC
MDKLLVTEHLGELRKRIIVSFVAVVIGFGLSFHFSEQIFSILILPMNSSFRFSFSYPFIFIETLKTSNELVFLALTEPLWMHFKIAIISSFILVSPIIFYEVWKFISPGLLAKEKKYVVPFVCIASFLFLLGALFCFIFILPFAVKFLLTYKTENLKDMLSVGRYIDFCLKFIVAFGAIFELPVIMVVLTKARIVTPDFLAKNRKYAIVLAFVVAALLTPTPDAFNCTLMAFPIIIMYETGILASRFFSTKQKGGRDDKIEKTGEKND